MPNRKQSEEPTMVLRGWQGVTVAIPEEWNIGAISGDNTAGYARWDDDEMPRLEIKWASEKGFVDLNSVIDKYLKDLQKGRKKKDPEIHIERDIKLPGKSKRKKAGVKCFHWKGGVEGYGAAWICKECGRTMIAQVMVPPGQDEEEARDLAGSIMLGIEDHPRDGWVLWSAYGMDCWIPEDFKLSGQRLMAGLIEFSFEKETETIKVARWGMANVALKRKSLKEWTGGEMAKDFRKHAADAEESEVKGHEALDISGSNIAGVQLLHRFYFHCTGKLFADHFLAKAWHCEPTNSIHYVETYLDRENVGLVDEIVGRVECHPGCNDGAEGNEPS